MKENRNKIVDVLKLILSEKTLNDIRQGDFKKPYTKARTLIRYLFEIQGNGLEDEMEIDNIYHQLQEELVLESFFTRDRIQNFKENPKKYASAKCIKSTILDTDINNKYFNPVSMHDLSDEYVLIKEHQNTFTVFYIDEHICYLDECTNVNATLLDITMPYNYNRDSNTLSLKYYGRLSIFILYEGF